MFTAREFLRHSGGGGSGLGLGLGLGLGGRSSGIRSGQELREFSAFSGTLGLTYLALSSAIFAGWFSTAVKTAVEVRSNILTCLLS